MVEELTTKECFLIDLFNFPGDIEVLVISRQASTLERLQEITARFENLFGRFHFANAADPLWKGRVIDYDQHPVCW